jgi:hypothetical protein
MTNTKSPVGAAGPSDAVDPWVPVSWWQAMWLRRLLKNCHAQIELLRHEHNAAVASAEADRRREPPEPARLVRLEEQRAAIETLLGTESAGATASKEERWRVSAAIALGWTLAAVVLWWVVGFGTGGESVFDGSRQFVLLSMAIALGSYFGKLVRDLKIRRSQADKGTGDGGTRAGNLLLDIRYIRAGEYLVVLLGFLALLRIVLPMFPGTVGTGGLTPAQADAGLVLLLAAVILHTIALHVREWLFR